MDLSPACPDYTDWTEHLAAKGMVVVHVAYPSHLIIEGQEEPIVSGGRSNHPNMPSGWTPWSPPWMSLRVNFCSTRR